MASEILPVCKIRRLAGPTQEILRKSEAHQMLAQSLGPRTQSSGPSGTKLGSPRHKAGVGSSHKSGFPRVLHLGGCIVLHWADQEQAILWMPRGVLWVPVGGGGYVAPLKDDCVPTWRHCCLPPSGPIQHCPLNAPQWIVMNFQMVPWINLKQRISPYRECNKIYFLCDGS